MSNSLPSRDIPRDASQALSSFLKFLSLTFLGADPPSSSLQFLTKKESLQGTLTSVQPFPKILTKIRARKERRILAYLICIFFFVGVV